MNRQFTKPIVSSPSRELNSGNGTITFKQILGIFKFSDQCLRFKGRLQLTYHKSRSSVLNVLLVNNFSHNPLFWLTETHIPKAGLAEASAYFITWPQAWDMNSLHTSAAHSRTYLKTTQLVTRLFQFTVMDLVVHVGPFRNFGPTDISWSLEVKTSVLENRQLPRTHELKTIYHHSSFLSQTLYHVVRRSNNYLAFHLFIFQKDFLRAVSNMLSFFKVLQKGLSTMVYRNRHSP